jgi:putative transposase
VRFADTWALRQRTDASYVRHERRGDVETSAALTQLNNRPEAVWLNEVSSVPLQPALRHLDNAFCNCIAQRSRYPAFKKQRGKRAAI